MQKKLRLIILFLSLFTLTEINAQTYQHLKLTSMCSDNPQQNLRWRVRNTNAYSVIYTWRVVDGGPNAPASSQQPGVIFTAKPGDNFFYSSRWASGANVMVIYVNGVEQQGGRKAAGNAQCSTFDVFLTCLKKVDDCTMLATFGYNNPNLNTNFTILHGTNNYLSGGTIFRGESDTVFTPGINHNAFKIRYACTDNIEWTLAGPFGWKKISTTSAFDSACHNAVKVFVKCIYPLSNGNHQAIFGYENTGSDTISISDISDNFLTGTIINGAQATCFAPGKIDSAFAVEFSGIELKWTLIDYNDYSRTATADIIYAGMCVEAIKINVKCIRPNLDGTTTAIFGYNNLNATAITIPNSNENRLIYEDAGQLPITTFLPGNFDSAFSAIFSGSEMKWALTAPDGVERFAVANDEYCKNCDSLHNTSARMDLNSITLSPNPATDNLLITFSSTGSYFTGQLIVTDMSGKVVLQNDYNETASASVNLAENRKGIYFLKIISGDGFVVKRITKL